MTNPEIYKYGVETRFSSDNQPDTRGRKKNRFRHLQDEYDLSSEDVNNIISYLLSMNHEEIGTLAKDKSTPVIMLAFASAIISAIKKGELNQIESMLNRSIGKPADKVNVELSSFAEWVKRVTEDKAD